MLKLYYAYYIGHHVMKEAVHADGALTHTSSNAATYRASHSRRHDDLDSFDHSSSHHPSSDSHDHSARHVCILR